MKTETRKINGAEFLRITSDIKKEFLDYLERSHMHKTELSKRLNKNAEFVRNVLGDRQGHISRETYELFKQISRKNVNFIGSRIVVSDKMRERVRKWLEGTNVTRHELSHFIGFSENYVDNLLNGCLKRVNVCTWRKLLDVMNGKTVVQHVCRPVGRPRKAAAPAEPQSVKSGHSLFFSKFRTLLDAEGISSGMKERIFGAVFHELVSEKGC
jgi:hypothetical protein